MGSAILRIFAKTTWFSRTRSTPVAEPGERDAETFSPRKPRTMKVLPVGGDKGAPAAAARVFNSCRKAAAANADGGC